MHDGVLELRDALDVLVLARFGTLSKLPPSLTDPVNTLHVLDRALTSRDNLEKVREFWARQAITPFSTMMRDPDLVSAVRTAVRNRQLETMTLPLTGRYVTPLDTSRLETRRKMALPPGARPPPVGEWPLQDRLEAVCRRAMGRVPANLVHVLEEMVTPKALGIMAGLIAFGALAHLTPWGWAADLFIVALTFAFGGLIAVHALADLIESFYVTNNATTDGELDEAAECLARAVVGFGTLGIMALLHRFARGGDRHGYAQPKPTKPSPPKKYTYVNDRAGGVRRTEAPAPLQRNVPPKSKPKPVAEGAESPTAPKPSAELPDHVYDLTPGIDTGQPIRFGQKGVSPKFSSEGKFKGADIDEIVAKLKSGELHPADIPIQYIWVNGEKVVVNNRSLTALTKAGFEPVNTVDMTGKLPAKGPDSLASVLERLDEMGGKPSDSMPIRSIDGDRASPPRETVKISPRGE